jgi:hypothetical protein
VPADSVTRLVDLEVQEVSLVDRPANMRKFLIVKSAGDTMPNGAELTSDGKGGLLAPVVTPILDPAVVVAPVETAEVAPVVADTASAAPVEPARKSELEIIRDGIVALLASAEPIEKIGRKMAGPRLAKLRDLYKAIGDLLAEVDDEVEKAAPAAPAPVSADVERLAKSVRVLTQLVQRQNSELKELRGGVRPSSNTTQVGEQSTNVAEPTAWPADFNANHNPEDDIF